MQSSIRRARAQGISSADILARPARDKEATNRIFGTKVDFVSANNRSKHIENQGAAGLVRCELGAGGEIGSDRFSTTR